MTKHDICEFCDGKIEYRTIRARFNFKGQTIYIDNVPAWVCNTCGEEYFDAPIYKRLEEIARHRNQIVSTVCFPLAEYNMAIS
jgi:YgiT-type zinc finger domain-containing protein